MDLISEVEDNLVGATPPVVGAEIGAILGMNVIFILEFMAA